MRVRCITISLALAEEDFENQGATHLNSFHVILFTPHHIIGLVLGTKLRVVKQCQEALTTSLTSQGYEVQTVRVSLNSFESWLLTRSQGWLLFFSLTLLRYPVDQIVI